MLALHLQHLGELVALKFQNLSEKFGVHVPRLRRGRRGWSLRDDVKLKLHEEPQYTLRAAMSRAPPSTGYTRPAAETKEKTRRVQISVRQKILATLSRRWQKGLPIILPQPAL